MKKLFFIVALISTTFTFSQNFPGKEVDLLVNKELKVLPKAEAAQKYGFEGFYTDDALKNVYECCDSYNAKYLSLANKIFKVHSFEPYKNSIGTEKFKLKIENSETGILFYDYNPKMDMLFPFEVIGGLTLPTDFYCKDITQTVDKFTGETKYNTNSGGIQFLKVVKDKVSKIYLSINQPGATFSLGKKGLTILLENNKKIEKPEAEIKANPNGGGGYYNSTFIELTAADINLLKANNMTDLRLYVNDTEVQNRTKYKELLKCLTK
ncbi:MAG: hypothetical protein Q8Q51_11240 [Lutibacter sp.]|nr:hypothetical protein [Lutibacter sp.]